MAAVAFNPVFGSVDFLDGSGLDYEVPGTYCTAFRQGGELDDIRPVSTPGELGHGTQNFGGGSEDIEIEVMYIAESEDACITQFRGEMRALAAGTFGMAISGEVYDGCTLASKPKSTQPKYTGVAETFKMEAMLSITCWRPS